jgi:hypothetical protein
MLLSPSFLNDLGKDKSSPISLGNENEDDNEDPEEAIDLEPPIVSPEKVQVKVTTKNKPKRKSSPEKQIEDDSASSVVSKGSGVF